MKRSRFIATLLAAVCGGVALAWAAATSLSPPALFWGSAGQVTIPVPTSLIGYDSSTSNPCIVGSTATCQLSVNVGGGSGETVTANQGTPAVVGNAWPVNLVWGGAAVGLTNAVPVQPGTGATFPVSAVSLPLPTGAALDASVGTTNTDLGPPGATACATDTGSCSLNALIQRLAQRLTTINTTLGSPFQAGGAIAALPTGSALIGSVSTSGRVDVTPTVQNASYVSGNSLGGLVSFTLPRTATGILQSVSVQFIGGATTQVNAYLFDSNPSGSTFTDKSTFTIAAADEAKRINKTGFALTPAAVVGDTVTAAAVDNYAKPFSSTATIYLAIVSTGTFTPTSTTDMRVSITYVQNAL